MGGTLSHLGVGDKILDIYNGQVSEQALSKKVILAIATIASISTLVRIVKAIKKRRSNNRLYQKFKGPKGHWLYGSIPEITFDEAYYACMEQYAVEYGDLFKMSILSDTYMVANSPETLAAIMKTTEPKDPIGYGFLQDWLGKGLLINHGPQWSRMRRLLTPGFHSDNLKPYVDVMNKSSQIMVDKWKDLLKSEEYVEVFEHVSLFTIDSLLKCIFSQNTDCQHIGMRHPYIQSVYDISTMITERFKSVMYRSNFIYFNFTKRGQDFKAAVKISHDFDMDVINTRRLELMQNNNAQSKRKYMDFLDILLSAKDEDGKGLTDKEILNEVDTFMFGGHDTTASGVSWCLYNLARFPELQERCRQEVIEVMGDKQEITWSSIGKLEYLTMFLKESMRLFPPVPLISRLLTKDFTCPDGRIVPSGTVLWENIYLTHRNPKVWPDPLVFDPQRFTLQNSENRHSHAFIAFSAGPRNCIGQHFALNEMKICLAHVLKNFRLELDSSRPPSRVEKLILRAKDGLWIKPTVLTA